MLTTGQGDECDNVWRTLDVLWFFALLLQLSLGVLLLKVTLKGLADLHFRCTWSPTQTPIKKIKSRNEQKQVPKKKSDKKKRQKKQQTTCSGNKGVLFTLDVRRARIVCTAEETRHLPCENMHLSPLTQP
jgi:hypothetical protein